MPSLSDTRQKQKRSGRTGALRRKGFVGRTYGFVGVVVGAGFAAAGFVVAGAAPAFTGYA